MPPSGELSRAQAEARIRDLGFFIHDDIEVVSAVWDGLSWLYIFCAPGNPYHAWYRVEADLATVLTPIEEREPPQFDLEQLALTSNQALRKLVLRRRMRM